MPGGCFTKVSRALQNIISKFFCVLQKSYFLWEFQDETLCVCPKLYFGHRYTAKFELEILTLNVISGIAYFRDIILESSRNVSETTPWCHKGARHQHQSWWLLWLWCHKNRIRIALQPFMFQAGWELGNPSVSLLVVHGFAFLLRNVLCMWTKHGVQCALFGALLRLVNRTDKLEMG